MALSPLGPVAGAFCLDNHEVACVMGPVGSAKTTASMLRLARHAYEQPPHDGIARTRFAIVRNTGPQLTDTTMKSWFRLFPTDNRFRKYTSTTKTQTWRFVPKGQKHVIHAEFMFRALDDEEDVANLLSLEVTGFYFNELREINTSIFAHAGRRKGRFPGAMDGGCRWSGIIADTNPWPQTSEYHEMFVAAKRDGYAFFKQPGGMEPNAENLENLEQTPETLKLPWNDPARRAQGRTYYEKALRDYNKYDADTMVHCKYGTSRAGKPCFPSYDDNAHCKPFELLKDSDGRVPVKIGWDNTGRHPAALISQRTANGQWRARYEVIGDGMGLKQHAATVAAFLAEKIPTYRIEKITCDPAGAAKGADDLDMRMVIQRQFPGVTVVNARTNDIETRLAAGEDVFRRMVNGEPAILIHPDCKILRTACLSKYQFRKLKLAGEERFTETPDKISPFADIADALQYLLLGGGEGRVYSDGTGKEPNWPRNGAAVTPKPPDQQRRNQGAVFDPRMGTFFNER